MNRTRLPLPILVVLIAGVIAIIAATSSGAKKTRPVASNSAITLRQTSLGKTLVDANGRTLYLFEGDRANVSRLSAAGRAVWPPFTSTSRPVAQGGVSAAQIGTIPGAGGASQVTYNRHPLYYYVGDHKPGQALGQRLTEFGALWYVLSPAGRAITSAPKAAAPTTSSTPAGGGASYGY